jgi:nitrite reductase/ring-hydroxylating ferredoxin subunit
MPEIIELVTADQVPLGTVKRFEINDLAVALEGCLLECWLHGSAFDVRTGEPQSLPALTPVATFPVTIDSQGTLSVTI